MYPKYDILTKIKPSGILYSQRGLGLPSALFLILIMILIVGAINQLNDMSAAAYGREWLGMRAFYAAESGAQLSAVYQLTPEVSPACTSTFISNLNLTATGLNECHVSVVCEEIIVNAKSYITLTSTGVCGTGIDAAKRVIQIRLAL
jgi:MSHA biogenesis protein MshP